MNGDASAKRPLGVAIIGDGLMAKEHSMAWRSVQAVYGDVPVEPHLVVIVHPDLTRASAAAAQYGVAKFSTSWEEAIADPDVDVVDIVTPNAFHKDVAIAAAKAGKHVWCEKPLALNADDALEMTLAAEAAGVSTLVGFTYLHNPGLVLAKQLADSGELGEIVSFTGVFNVDTMIDPTVPFTWRTDRSRAGGGALGDLGSHMISIARYVAGDVTMVCGNTRIVVDERQDAAGVMRSVDNDDLAFALLEFGNGATGSLQASRVATGGAFEVAFTLTGTKGAVRFNQQDSHKLEVVLASDKYGGHGYRTIELGPGHGHYGHLWPMSGINVGLHELKIFEVRRLIDGIVGSNRVLPDFREATEIQRVIEAIERSAASRAWQAVSR